MRRIFFYFFIFLNFIFSFAQKNIPLQQEKEFGSNPGDLRMFVHLPSNLKNGTACPLVIVLHGCSQNAEECAEQTGWNKLSDLYGFYVLYPEQKMMNNASRCFNWFLPNDIEKGKGESESIKQMTDLMRKNYKIDSSQIFIAGMSAGAAMSVVIMSVYPQLFNCGAVFAGGPYKTATDIFSASKSMSGKMDKTPEEWGKLVREQNPYYKGNYPRIIIYQGTNDFVVNKNGAHELIEQWCNLLQADTSGFELSNSFADVPEIKRKAFVKNNKEVLVYYEIKSLGHALLVDPGPCANQGGAKGFFSSDKNFHSTWQTAVDFGLVPNEKIKGKKEVLKNEKELNYFISPVKGNKYVWKINSELKSEYKTNEIKINWGTKPGTITVMETDTIGCKYFHPVFFVNVKE